MSRTAPKRYNLRQGNCVETGSSSKEPCDDIDDSEITEYKELSYKFFKHHDYKIRGPNGEFRCPFCASKDETDYQYSDLLQHAIRVAEGSLSGKQRAKHYAMAKYMAFDLADDLNQLTGGKRSRPNEDKTKNKTCNRGAQTPKKGQSKVDANLQKLAMAEKREREALEKVCELESTIDGMNDQLNALITKDRLSNDELQNVRRELIEGLSDIQHSKCDKGGIGIKKYGELDPEDFISELHGRLPQGDIVIKGVELCTTWQEKIKDPWWYPFRIVEDDTGKPERLVVENDITLRALKEEWGQGIHDAVVGGLTDLQEHNPSASYAIPELWNFGERRKAELCEVIRYIFQLRAAKAKPKPRAQTKKNSKY